MSVDVGKKAAGFAAAQWVQDGMCLGLGSGSTANWFHIALAERIQREGIQVCGVAPSQRTEDHCASLGIPTVPLTAGMTLDLAVDGADEIAPDLSLIKGGGGALIREKIVVAAARSFIVIADSSKSVSCLGVFPLPIAVIPFGWESTQERLQDLLQVEVGIRGGKANPFVSDDGLYILDAHCQEIPDPITLYPQLRTLPGVADCGLFVQMAERAIVGHPDGTTTEMLPQ